MPGVLQLLPSSGSIVSLSLSKATLPFTKAPLTLTKATVPIAAAALPLTKATFPLAKATLAKPKCEYLCQAWRSGWLACLADVRPM